MDRAGQAQKLRDGAPTVLKWLASSFFLVLLVSTVGDRVTVIYSERSTASDMKAAWKDEVEELVSREVEQLTILIQDLAPYARVSNDCPNSLPLPVRDDPGTICRDVGLQEILDEQQRLLEIRAAHLEADLLQSKLTRLTYDGSAELSPEEQFRDLLSALVRMRFLANGLYCGEAKRGQFASRLAALYPERITDEVRATLVLSTSEAAPCDDFSPAWREAAVVVIGAFQEETRTIGASIDRSTVDGLTDAWSELPDLFRFDWLLIGLALGALILYAVAAALGRKRRDSQSQQPSHAASSAPKSREPPDT